MNGKRLFKGTILTVLCMVGMLYFNSSVSRAYWVVVSSNNTNVRNGAGKNNEVMTVVNAGDRLDVVSEETDSEGKIWYLVSINNVSGYVRSDTVKKETEADAALTTTAQVEPVASTTTVNAIASQAATVNKNDVNVRSSASTSASAVAKLSEGAAVTLVGTTSDSEGKTWYQVNFINNGSNVTGYIREDFIEPGEVMGELPEGEGGEDELADMYGDMPTEEEPATYNNDYELFYEPDQEGVDCWYVHDNIAQKRYKLEQLMQADEMNTNNLEIKDKEIAKMKMVVIILAVLLVLALLAAGFFGFKYNDAKYDDDDDDDDDDFQEAPPVRRRARQETERTGRSEGRSGKPVQRRPETASQRRPASAAGTQRKADAEGRTAQRSPQTRKPEGEMQRRAPQSASGTRRPVQSSSAARNTASAQPTRKPLGAENTPVRNAARGDVEWKSKNFLTSDDEEVSFINMDEDE